MDKLEVLYQKLEKKTEEVNFFYDAYENQTPILKVVTDEIYPGDFLKGEKLEDIGHITYSTSDIPAITQYWSNGKSVEFQINNENELEVQYRQADPETDTNTKKLLKVIDLMKELVPIQAEIDALEEEVVDI